MTVSIPPAAHRQAGQIQWPTSLPPNPETDFATLNVTPLTEAHQPQAWLKQHLPRSRRVLVYVHGFNNHFDDAVYQLAQVAHDSGADAAPILLLLRRISMSMCSPRSGGISDNHARASLCLFRVMTLH